MDWKDNGEQWYARQVQWKKPDRDARSHSDIDYARIVHSSSFRRLQGKTQILNLGDSDFYRTRLTHTLEVAQICAGITKQLQQDYSLHLSAKYLPDRSLIQAIGFAHDLGHPPFGHGGEVALNYCMRDHGGFEGNGQTLRILSKLEHFSDKFGAALTRRALLGILKYPCSYSTVRGLTPSLIVKSTSSFINKETSKPPKCYLDCEKDVVDWILAPLSDDDRQLFQSYTEFQPTETKKKGHHKPKYKSLDCSIMELADDIAYCVHDFEDAIAMNLISKEKFLSLFDKAVCCDFLDYVKNKDSVVDDGYDYFVNELFKNSSSRKHFISRLVGHFINAITFEEKLEFCEPLLRYQVKLSEPQRLFLKELGEIVNKCVISSPSVQHLEFKGQHMVVSVFEAISSDPERLLPEDVASKINSSEEDYRTICDYIAGSTDLYLLKMYERLFSPRMGSVFDKL